MKKKNNEGEKGKNEQTHTKYNRELKKKIVILNAVLLL